MGPHGIAWDPMGPWARDRARSTRENENDKNVKKENDKNENDKNENDNENGNTTTHPEHTRAGMK